MIYAKYKPGLIQGDFLLEYKKCIEPKSVNLFLSDPPYGLFTKHRNITGVSDPSINLHDLGCALDYLLVETGTVLLFCDLNLLIKLKQSLPGFDFRFEYVLYKANGSPTHRTRPLSNLEYIAVFKRSDAKAGDLTFHPYESGEYGEKYSKRNLTRSQSTRKNQKRKIDRNTTGKRYIKQSLKMAGKCNLRKSERTPHPFQKSEAIVRKLIRVHSNKNDLICDGFAGSGTTLVGAYRENRRSIGFEIVERWYLIARERTNNVTKEVQLFN